LESPDSFARLSRRVRESDHAAFSELFEATHVGLLRYAWRLLGEEESARDVVQTAFIRLWKGRSSLDPEKSVRALLYATVRNLAFNQIRDEQRRRALLAEAYGTEQHYAPEQDHEIDSEALSVRIGEWIAEMPPRRREAFVLSRFDQLSHHEIARVMNLTPNTVNSHIMLALKHLRERLGAFERG